MQLIAPSVCIWASGLALPESAGALRQMTGCWPARKFWWLGGSGLAPTELFDHCMGRFSASGDMGSARSGHTVGLRRVDVLGEVLGFDHAAVEFHYYSRQCSCRSSTLPITEPAAHRSYR